MKLKLYLPLALIFALLTFVPQASAYSWGYTYDFAQNSIQNVDGLQIISQGQQYSNQSRVCTYHAAEHQACPIGGMQGQRQPQYEGLPVMIFGTQVSQEFGLQFYAPSGTQFASIKANFAAVKLPNNNPYYLRYDQGASGPASEFADPSQASGQLIKMIYSPQSNGNPTGPTPQIGTYYAVLRSVAITVRDTQVKPTVTINSMTGFVNGASPWVRGRICAAITATNAGSGIKHYGITKVDGNAQASLNTETVEYGDYYRPYRTPISANACFDSNTLASGTYRFSAFAQSGANVVGYGDVIRTVRVDNTDPLVAPVKAPTDLLRPNINITATDAHAGMKNISVKLDGVDISEKKDYGNFSVTTATSSSVYISWKTDKEKFANIAAGPHKITYIASDLIGNAVSGEMTFITPPAPISDGLVNITGKPEPGQTLTCNRGTWQNAEKYFYTWKLDNVNVITRGQGDKFTVAGSYVGKKITCVSIAVGPGGEVSSSSAPVTIAAVGKAPATNTPTTGPGAISCVGSAVTTVKNYRVKVGKAFKTLRIKQVRKGKCIGLTVLVKKGKKFVPVKFTKMTVKVAGQKARLVKTNVRGVVSIKYTTTLATSVSVKIFAQTIKL